MKASLLENPNAASEQLALDPPILRDNAITMVLGAAVTAILVRALSAFCTGLAGRTRSQSTPQFGSQFLSDGIRIDAVPNDLRSNENDQFGPFGRSGGARKKNPDIWNIIEQGNAAAILFRLLLDEAGQQYGLTARDYDGTLDLAL